MKGEWKPMTDKQMREQDKDVVVSTITALSIFIILTGLLVIML